jgi:hypothetical protein
VEHVVVLENAVGEDERHRTGKEEPVAGAPVLTRKEEEEREEIGPGLGPGIAIQVDEKPGKVVAKEGETEHRRRTRRAEGRKSGRIDRAKGVTPDGGIEEREEKKGQGGSCDDESDPPYGDARRGPPDQPDAGGKEEARRGVRPDRGREPGEEPREEKGPNLVGLSSVGQRHERPDRDAKRGDMGEKGRAEYQGEGGDSQEQGPQESGQVVVEGAAEAEDAENGQPEENGAHEPRGAEQIAGGEKSRPAGSVLAGPAAFREKDVPDREGLRNGGRRKPQMPAGEDARLEGVRHAVREVGDSVENVLA